MRELHKLRLSTGLCKQCGKPRAAGDGYYCVEHRLHMREAWQRKVSKRTSETKKRIRQGRLDAEYKRRYGITLSEYEELLVAQQGGCAICGVRQEGNNGFRLSVDHCHDTGKIRGLLCNNCNRALGLLKDSTIILEEALGYLRASR